MEMENSMLSVIQSSGIGNLRNDETEEINELLKRLESMETMEDSEELQNQIMNTVQDYPELMQAMRQYNNDHDFEKEKIEYERLKLEEQISMLELVVEEGIRQTTELQEIHHDEVEDLHNQILNLQKQVAAHVRFIDDHCVDSEEIRAEMQRDIDQLVVELEDQCRQNRTAESLMEQVNRLEIDLASAHEVLKQSEQNKKRAEALLAARVEEKDQEVGDLNEEIKWLRGEYDTVQAKVEQMEQQLNERKTELEKTNDESEEVEIKIKELIVRSDGLQIQLEDQFKNGKEQIEQLKDSLNEEQNISSKQRIELERLKSELEKSKDIINRLRQNTPEQPATIENFEIEKLQMLSRVSQASNDATTKEKLRLLEMKLERKTSAFDDLKKENMRLREVTARRNRRENTKETSRYSPSSSFKEMSKSLTRSLTDLTNPPKESSRMKRSKMKFNQATEEGSLCDSDDAGYCSSLRSFSRSLQSSTSLLSLDQTGLAELYHPQQRFYHGSRSKSHSSINLRTSESLHAVNNFDLASKCQFTPQFTSTPKKNRMPYQSRSSLSNDSNNSSDCDSVNENVQKIYLKPLAQEKTKKVKTSSIAIQTDSIRTNSIKTQATPMMVTARVQTSPDKVQYFVQPRDAQHKHFDTDTYLPAQRIREAARNPRDSQKDADIRRLHDKLEDKRSETRQLRQLLREKDEALARHNAEIKSLKRDLYRSTNFENRRAITSNQNQGHDISINLKEGSDHDSYGQIHQIRPGQIQELKTTRTTVKNLNGLPVKYSTKVSVKCGKVAVFF